MADWPVLGGGDFAKLIGTIAQTCGANDTKTAWQEYISSTAENYIGLWVSCVSTTDYGVENAMIDIGIGGPGSEKVILENFAMSINYVTSAGFFLPVAIPAGTRVAVRAQTNRSSNAAITINLIGVSGDFFIQSSQQVATYGAVVATTEGTALPICGTKNVKGSYVEITSATTYSIRHLIIDLLWAQKATSGNRVFHIDIAVGSVGNEQIIIPDIFAWTWAGELPFPPVLSLPIKIPIGSRIAARTSCTDNSAGYTIQLILHGIT